MTNLNFGDVWWNTQQRARQALQKFKLVMEEHLSSMLP